MDVYSYQCSEGVNQCRLFGTLAPTGKSSIFSVKSFSKLFCNFLRCTCTFLLHHSQAEQHKKNNNRIPRSTSASPNIKPMYNLWRESLLKSENFLESHLQKRFLQLSLFHLYVSTENGFSGRNHQLSVLRIMTFYKSEMWSWICQHY